MKINTDILKRSFRSLQIRLSALLGMLSIAYQALPPEAQLVIYMRIEPLLPSAGWMGIIAAVILAALRAKTTKALADR
jgi:hypothetical protein